MNNKYQEYNLKKKQTENPDTFGWSYNRCIGYKCIECGENVSPATIKYFDYNVEFLKCYNCQSKN